MAAWPIPTAKEMAERFAGTLEAAILVIRPLIDPKALSRAVRSARGMLAQLGRAIVLEVRELHDHLTYWSRQLFADTAEDEMVLRHAGIWGIDQRAAVKALGTVTIEGVAGTVLPSGIELSASDASLYVTTEAGTIGVGGSVIVAAEAVTAGSAGNIEAGIRLSTVAAFPEISKATVETDFAGGADEMSYDELRAAVLAHIRQRPHGGAGFDYPTWVKQVADVKAVRAKGDWIGRGSVGVIVAMKDADGNARAATDPECEAILAYLGPQSSATGVKPVTAYVVVVSAVLTDIAINVRLRPDTVATRAAVTEAFQRFILTIGDADDAQNASPIGAIIEPSRISEAISAANDEYAHDLISPAARYVLGATEYPVAGTITWADA